MAKLKGFDGIRALAAVSVVLTHLHVLKALDERNILPSSVINSIDGRTGVQAFFVLSGFLITHLLVLEREKHGTVSLHNFYIRRSLRIFPLYFLVLFLVGIAYLIGEQVTNPESMLFAAVYAYNFIPKEWYSGLLGHTWSLAVEEHFYLIWPFVFISLASRSQKLVRLLLLFIVGSFFSALAITHSEWVTDNFFVGRWSFIAGANIAIGALLALYVSGEARQPAAMTVLRTYPVLTLGMALIFSEVWLGQANHFLIHHLTGLGFALLVAWLFLNQQHRLTRALEVAPLSYLGKVSYGIYMYQGFFLATGPGRAPGQTWPPDQYLGLLLLVLVVPLSYHYFEKPLIELKSRFQHRPGRSPGTPARHGQALRSRD